MLYSYAAGWEKRRAKYGPSGRGLPREAEPVAMAPGDPPLVDQIGCLLAFVSADEWRLTAARRLWHGALEPGVRAHYRAEARRLIAEASGAAAQEGDRT